MTETKQDIQAQNDQLDGRWKERADARRGAKGVKSMFVWAFAFGAVAVALGFMEVGVFAENMSFVVLLCASPFIAYGLKKNGPLRRSSEHYELTVDRYESKRAKLQAKLDALD
jgi:predicted branched-subunit amino acid permease